MLQKANILMYKTQKGCKWVSNFWQPNFEAFVEILLEDAHKISVSVNPALNLFQYDELCSKGNFTREDIVTVLTAHQVS